MDVNAEIATRAAAVLVLMQDWLATTPPLDNQATVWEHRLLGELAKSEVRPGTSAIPHQLLERASELLATRPPAPSITLPELWPRFQQLARGLIRHLATLPPPKANPGELAEVRALLEEKNALPPAAWRRALRRLLYANPEQRLALCTALSYSPGADFFEPLLIQTLLGESGSRRVVLENTKFDPLTSRQQAVDYLLNEPEKLATCLEVAEQAVPFVHVLARELEEIARRRGYLDLHAERLGLPRPNPAQPAQTYALSQPFAPGLGPFGLAETADLMGLGLSGGGIRSATFALGAVQALAQRGWLPRLDYLSTVSGGGYLGCWLAVLIQRLGSVHTAQQHLDPTLAANPRAEENRPVRWLRSFSNYLTPEASLFSTDTWTLATTWLRNTLLNQTILALFLGAVLLVPQFLLASWTWWGRAANRPWALGAGLLLLALTAGLAGWQQRWYDRRVGEAPPAAPPGLGWLPVPGVLPPLLLAAAWFLTARTAFDEQVATQWWPWLGKVGGGLAGWLLVVAALGRYHLCFNWKTPRPWLAWLLIALITGLSATAAAALLLPVARYLTEQVAKGHPDDWHQQANIMMVAPALVAEALGLALTVRMALLGAAFTDERREWWGRLGAQLHLTALGWLLLTGISLVVPHLIAETVNSPALPHFWPATAAAWVALVGAGVKLAQSPAAPAHAGNQSATTTTTAIDKLTRLVPYLFITGLLVLLTWSLQKLLALVGGWLQLHGWPTVALHTTHYHGLLYYPAWQGMLGLVAGLGLLSWLLAWRVGVNEFSLHHFYKNRLLRAYLGASRPRDEREANPFTDFDTADDLLLCHLRHCPLVNANETRPQPYYGPLPLINTALNVTRGGELAHQDRKAESFVFSPLYAGYDFSRMVPVQHPDGRYAEYGFRPTYAYAYPAPAAAPVAYATAGGVHVGTAMAISGAAANPNMGYHSSPVTAFLLTIFNVRLGWWMGNPRRSTWQSANPKTGLGYLLKDLFGRAAPTDDYVCLSDGGHFDNLGLYELVRRRCRYIIICDGEEDADRRFEALGNAIRRCRVDFGAEIAIDLGPLRTRDEQGHTTTRSVLGTIAYPDQPVPGVATPASSITRGHILYLKATLTGHEPEDVLEYAHQNDTFPHQSTGDQFFSEPQFESYRQLGYTAALEALHPAGPGPLPDPAGLFASPGRARAQPAVSAVAAPPVRFARKWPSRRSR